MQTHFSLAQLADPQIREAEKILRNCVHCGFCTATCPTYVLLGDELDGPRGRIYLIKEMLEKERPATAPVVKHIDRCLSCLSCMTTCPSGVHYQHLVDQARHHIERTYRRPMADRVLRGFLATVLPRPGLFRLALRAAKLTRPLSRLLPGRLRGLAELAPPRVAATSPVDRPQIFPALGKRRKRVALLSGCAQQVVAPQINEATVRLLTRHGCEVVVPSGAGCCGGLTHHLGRPSRGFAKANIDAWTHEIAMGGLDAVVINASGCGVTVRDYGYMLRGDRDYADKAARISSLAKDLCEVMAELGLVAPAVATGRRVAYHAACSLQHGLAIRHEPRALLTQAGFTVLDVPEAHLCCGSAGTYNMLQPEIAERLRERKLRNIASTDAEVVAAGNAGCITQLARGSGTPVVHTAELLDWATGGPMPAALSGAATPTVAR
jgi:glycolate oxidase iron-sulfur subunit